MAFEVAFKVVFKIGLLKGCVGIKVRVWRAFEESCLEERSLAVSREHRKRVKEKRGGWRVWKKG